MNFDRMMSWLVAIAATLFLGWAAADMANRNLQDTNRAVVEQASMPDRPPLDEEK